jgi:hypoxanthine phosphoribosyltransferase
MRPPVSFPRDGQRQPNDATATAVRELISADAIEKRVAELGRAITTDYAGSTNVVLVGILRGSLVFLADLARQVHLPLRMDCLGLRSYAGKVGGDVRVTAELLEDVCGADVIVVEDIIERGATLRLALEVVRAGAPRSIAVCALLRKPAAHGVASFPEARYVGFDIGQEFVVGYGLDYDGLFRNVPYVGVFEGSTEGSS